jgi:hypothetical protein
MGLSLPALRQNLQGFSRVRSRAVAYNVCEAAPRSKCMKTPSFLGVAHGNFVKTSGFVRLSLAEHAQASGLLHK